MANLQLHHLNYALNPCSLVSIAICFENIQQVGLGGDLERLAVPVKIHFF